MGCHVVQGRHVSLHFASQKFKLNLWSTYFYLLSVAMCGMWVRSTPSCHITLPCHHNVTLPCHHKSYDLWCQGHVIFHVNFPCHCHIIAMSSPHHCHIIFTSLPHHIYVISTSYLIHYLSSLHHCNIIFYVTTMPSLRHCHVIFTSSPALRSLKITIV